MKSPHSFGQSELRSGECISTSIVWREPIASGPSRRDLMEIEWRCIESCAGTDFIKSLSLANEVMGSDERQGGSGFSAHFQQHLALSAVSSSLSGGSKSYVIHFPRAGLLSRKTMNSFWIDPSSIKLIRVRVQDETNYPRPGANTPQAVLI